MAYSELEQFLGRGEEKVAWLLSMKNMGGLFGGGLVGHRLGSLVFGDGMPVLLCALLGAVLGMALTFQYHGLVILRRLLIRLRFYLRRAVRPQVLDSEDFFRVVERRAIPIAVSTHDGTPIIVPQIERTP